MADVEWNWRTDATINEDRTAASCPAHRHDDLEAAPVRRRSLQTQATHSSFVGCDALETTMSSAPPPSASAPITVPSLRAGPTPRRPGDYADLMRRVKQAGLLRRRPGYYVTIMAITGTMLAVGWTVFVLLG